MSLRYSRQRQAIFDYLQGRTDHPTAETVYEGVREHFPHISLGTVYRNLMLLSSLGEIQMVSLGKDRVHFDPRTDRHDHFLCERCGSVQDMAAVEKEDVLLGKARRGCRERITSFHICYTGVCSHCLQEEGDDPEATKTLPGKKEGTRNP